MRYSFLTTCVDSTAELIDAMVDQAVEVTLEEVQANCFGLDEWVCEQGYSGVVKDVKGDGGLTLQKDWHVSYHKSVYDQRPCYYIKHSGIEHIFVPPSPEEMLPALNRRLNERRQQPLPDFGLRRRGPQT